MTRAPLWLPLALLGLASTPALASDGVIEINHARALAGGVNGDLVQDPPGYPVRITQPGSYKLTGSLTIPNLETGINVTVRHVTIDFAGFGVRGSKPGLVSGRGPAYATPCRA